MSSKGENKKAKAISMPRTVHLSRKENFWTVRTKAGPFNKETSVALGIVIRDFAKVAKTMKEVKHLLSKSEVKVNGVVRTDHQFPIGLFDVIAVTKQKLFFRVVLDDKQRLIIKSMDAESKEKISKVTNKVMTTKGIQLTTNDGRTYYGVKANVGDSLKIKLPEGKVESVLEFKDGMIAYLTKGANCSKVATIKEIVPATQRRDKLVKLAEGKEEFETTAVNVVVVGKAKAEIEGLN